MIITLTTDFGLADPFVGIMKGVILGIAPAVSIVDITHEVPSYGVLEGAIALDASYRYFPAGTIHVAVVDPGVGSERRPIAVRSEGQIFIAPDNGVLSLACGRGAVAPDVYHLTNRALFNESVSRTFHGRDVFAPAAGHLAAGRPLETVGPRLSDWTRIDLPDVQRVESGLSRGVVLRIDKFGNLITNVPGGVLGSGFRIRIAGAEVRRLVSSYAEAPPGELVAIVGSYGYVEISIREGSAAKTLNAAAMAEIEVETHEPNQ